MIKTRKRLEWTVFNHVRKRKTAIYLWPPPPQKKRKRKKKVDVKKKKDAMTNMTNTHPLQSTTANSRLADEWTRKLSRRIWTNTSHCRPRDTEAEWQSQCTDRVYPTSRSTCRVLPNYFRWMSVSITISIWKKVCSTACDWWNARLEHKKLE